MIEIEFVNTPKDISMISMELDSFAIITKSPDNRVNGQLVYKIPNHSNDYFILIGMRDVICINLNLYRVVPVNVKILVSS